MSGEPGPRPSGQTRRAALGSPPALLCAGAVAMVVGVFLPWIRGLTQFHGIVDWNGASEEGDGLIVVFLAILTLAFVRWRTTLEEIDARSRWIPLGLGVVAGLIWVIAFRKAASLVYSEGPDGARLQIGLLVVAAGIVLAVVGGWLVAHDPNRRRTAAPPRRRGGRDPATGAEYSVRERVDPARPAEPD